MAVDDNNKPDNKDTEGMYTIGDDHELECPGCRKNICLIDVETDGCLCKGFEDTCTYCGARFVITAVDYDVTVYAELKSKK